MNYIFGYGSLICADSRSRTGIAGSAFAVEVNGFRRTWSAHPPGWCGTAVSVQRQPNARCNGVYFEVDDDSLALFDIREGGYDRVQIPWDHVSSYSEQPLPTDGNLWIYVSSETNLTPLAERPIMMSYVDVILNGCLDFSEEFAQQFIAQTDQWQNLVDDRANPKYVRPLATSERLVTIESIIKKLRPELWKTRQFVK